jgi:hypothetical protein
MAFLTFPRLVVVGLLGTAISSCMVSSTGGGSDPAALLRENEKVGVFASVNFEQLKKDMATGQGEHVASLAALLGVLQDQHPAFFTFVKERFLLVCPSEQVTANEMMAALTHEMSGHP